MSNKPANSAPKMEGLVNLILTQHNITLKEGKFVQFWSATTSRYVLDLSRKNDWYWLTIHRTDLQNDSAQIKISADTTPWLLLSVTYGDILRPRSNQTGTEWIEALADTLISEGFEDSIVIYPYDITPISDETSVRGSFSTWLVNIFPFLRKWI